MSRPVIVNAAIVEKDDDETDSLPFQVSRRRSPITRWQKIQIRPKRLVRIETIINGWTCYRRS